MENERAIEPDAKPHRRDRYLRRGLYVLGLVLLLICLVRLGPPAAATLQRAILAAGAPHLQMDNEEGALLFQALEMRAGRSIYRPLNDYPFVVGTYPPLYMALNAAFADPDFPGFKSGRILSLISCAICAFLIATVVFRFNRSLPAAILSGVLFLATYEVYHWIAYYRVDFMARVFATGGLAAFLLMRRSALRDGLSILLFAAAWFTKQTEIAAAAAVCLACLIDNRKAGLRYVALLAGAVLIPFGFMTLLTGGQFPVHTIYYNMNTFVPGDLLIWASFAWRFNRWLLMAGIAGFLIIATIRLRDGNVEAEKDRQQTLSYNALLIYGVTSLLPAFMIGKAGSAENYLLEPLGALCMLAGAAIPLRSSVTVRSLTAASAVLVLLTFHSLHLTRMPFRDWAFSPHLNPSPQNLAATSRAAVLVRAHPGETWTEYGILNLLAGRSIYYQPFIMSELARQKRVSSRMFIEDLERGRFSLIVSNYDFSSGRGTNVYAPDLIEVIQRKYDQTEVITGSTLVYYCYKYR